MGRWCNEEYAILALTPFASPTSSSTQTSRPPRSGSRTIGSTCVLPSSSFSVTVAPTCSNASAKAAAATGGIDLSSVPCISTILGSSAASEGDDISNEDCDGEAALSSWYCKVGCDDFSS